MYIFIKTLHKSHSQSWIDLPSMTRARPSGEDEEYYSDENYDLSNIIKSSSSKNGVKKSKVVTRYDHDYDATDDENGLDGKEIVKRDAPFNDSDSDSDASSHSAPNKIHKLDCYWPYSLEITEPENKDLLYLYSVDDMEIEISPCDHCHPAYIEIESIKDEINSTVSNLLSNMLSAKQTCCCPKANTKSIQSSLNSCSGFRFFYQNSKLHVYLKVDPASIPLIPKHIDISINQMLKKSYDDSFHLHNKSYEDASALSDTFDFPEAEIAAGFKLNLRGYQLRTISWIKNVEAVERVESNVINNNYVITGNECHMKIKLGETPYYVEFNRSPNLTKSPETVKSNPLKFYGGILADDTGSGKTVTTIGLIHSAPFTPKKEKLRRKRFGNLVDYIPTKASLIVCPSNILKQWTSEAKRCNPDLKVFGLSTILDHRKISWQDMIDADIVVISYQFLLNANYLKYKKANRNKKMAEIYAHLNRRVDIHKLHYHRLILDEFHELDNAVEEVKEFVLEFQADYVWGLTGTPSLNNLADQFDYFKLPDQLKTVFEKNKYARSEFIHKFIKRNVPNLQLPPIEPETIWIDLSADELALLAWRGQEAGVKEVIMMCSHYQLSEKATVPVSDFMSVDDAKIAMSSKKRAELDRLERSADNLQSHLMKILKEKPDSDVTELCTRVKESETQFKLAKSGYNYFQNVFNIINEPDKYECAICYEKIGQDLSILPCSHLYCYLCIKTPVEKNNACPLCNNPTGPKEIYRIKIKEPEVIKCEKLESIDTSKYGSKLIKLYLYITNLIETSEDARIILFLQYRDLTEFIAESFKELNINYVRVAGNVFQRQNAINKFRDSKDIRLIMMSSEDSVSGINLTQATHVILLHPFYTGMGEQADLAYEKQGISRAYRFGLQHPLKVVRFAARGTIEETITLQRENIRL